MQCYNPIGLSNIPGYPQGLQVPCGKCLACRIKQRTEWTLRILHELHSWKNIGCFLTLTYNEEKIPENGSLRKKDLQNYWKRLRKLGYKIKYYGCGEYGEKSERPHYHAIIFGLPASKKTEKILFENWGHGNIYLGSAEPDSIRYVAQYVDKKFTGDKAKEEYEEKNREPVFRVLSLGIGRDYCDNHRDQIVANLSMTMFGKKIGIPRYYVKRLDIDREKLSNYAKNKEIDYLEEVTGLSHSEEEYREMQLLGLNIDLVLENAWKKEAYKNQSKKNQEAAIKLRELKRKKRKI